MIQADCTSFTLKQSLNSAVEEITGRRCSVAVVVQIDSFLEYGVLRTLCVYKAAGEIPARLRGLIP